MTALYLNLVIDRYDGQGNPYVSGGGSLTPSTEMPDPADRMLVGEAPVPFAFHASGLPSPRVVSTDSVGPQSNGWTWNVAYTSSTPGSPAGASYYLSAGPAAFTATNASPCVVTWTPTASLTVLPNGTGVQLSGSPPAGFASGTTYFVVNANGDQVELAATQGGSPLASTGTGSGQLVVVQYNLSALASTPAAQPGAQYLPLTTGTPTAGEVPVFTGVGYATVPGAGGGGSGTVTSVNDVAPVAGNVTLTAAEVGADASGAAAAAQSAAESYAAGVAATAQSNAETYAAGAASTAQSNAEAASDPAGSAATAQSNAESFATSAVSTETTRAEAAEALLAPLVSPALTGTPTAPTAGAGTSTTQLATTAFVAAAVVPDSTVGDIQPSPGTQAAAGAVGKPSDAGHVHGQPPVFAPTGLTGVTAASRYVGATVSGPPVSGTYAVGDYAVDQAGAIWIAVSAGAAPLNGQFRRMGDHAWQFRPESYGASTGIFTVHDAVMASTGSGVLTSASGKFTAAMVGWLVLVNIGTAGANQAPLITTIASYQSATQVTLAANPAATAAGNPAIFAPDNTTALLACWTATQTYANASPFRSAEMVLADLYAMGTAPTLGSTSGPFYGYSLLPINVPDTTGAGPKMNLRIACERGPGNETNYWEQLTGQMAGSGIVVLLAAPATNGTWGIPSVIGGPTVASWSGGSLTGGFANIRLDVDDLKIVVPYNPGWIGVDARFLACLSGTRYGYQSFAAGVLGGGLGPNLGSTPGGSWNFNGAGIRFPVRNNNDLCSFDSVTCEGVADGIWIADHIDIRKLTVINHFNSIVVDATSGSGSGFIHGSWIGEASLEATGGSCVIVSGSGETHFPLVIGFLDSENSSTPNTVTDTGILFGHIQWYDITASVPKVSGTTNLKIVNNRLGPGLWGSPPTVPATTVAVTAANSPWRDAWVNVQPNGATITAIAVTTNGTATTITGVTSGWVFIPSGSTITLTYTGGTPTWQWWLS